MNNLHGAELSLCSQQSLSWSRNPHPFMKHKVPRSQEPIIRPYPEPQESSKYPQILFQELFSYYPPIYT
jgi:hypothetical protein